MESIKIAVTAITYLRKNLKRNTLPSWIIWRETVESIYEGTIESAALSALINSEKNSARKFKSNNSITEYINSIDADKKHIVLCLLELFRAIEENRSDYTPSRTSLAEYDKLINPLQFSEQELKEAKQKAIKWQRLKSENKFRNEIKIPASLLPITLDYTLRWILLLLFQKGVIDSLAAIAGIEGIALFFILQIGLIPFTMILFAFYRDKAIVKEANSMIAELKTANIKFSIKNSPWNYLLLSFYVISGSVVFNVILENMGEQGHLYVSIITILPYTIYLFALLSYFSKPRPNYKDIVQQIEKKEKMELTGTLSPEQNDEEIINLEVNLRSENEKVNAYVIEAALFGALAFSGFLTIMATGDFSVDNIAMLNSSTFHLINNMVNFSINNSEHLSFITGKSGLMAIICYESLFCSVFFLSVIASRLRFSHLTDYIDQALQLSRSVNEREEHFILNMNADALHPTVQKYNSRIKELLKTGYKKQNEIMPIMEYMEFFRTLGISTFFLIIITAGLFVSVQLSLILLFISLLSVVYFRFENFVRMLKLFYISMQEFYFRVNSIVHWGCWGMIIIALFLRSFTLPGGNVLMVFGFLFLFLHYLLSLFVPVKLNEDDIKIKEDAFSSESIIQRLLYYSFRISLAIYFLGYMFKAQHWPGAGPLLASGLLIMSFYFLFVRKTSQGPKWFNFLLSIALGFGLLAMLFKLQHWPGGKEMSLTATGILAIAAIITIKHRKIVRPMLQRAVFILSTVLILFNFGGYPKWIVSNLSLNYMRYQLFEDLQEYRTAFFANAEHGGLSEAKTEDEIKLLNEKLVSFSASYVFIEHPNEELLNEFAWDAFRVVENSLILNEAVNWSKRSLEFDDNWASLDTYASLLYKVGKYQEAETFAIKAYEKGNDGSTKELLKKIRKKLESTPIDGE